MYIKDFNYICFLMKQRLSGRPVFFCYFLRAREAELLFFVANRAKLYYDCKEQVFCERMDDKVKGEK